MEPPANPMTLALEAGDASRVAELCREYPRLVNTFDSKAQAWGQEQWMPLHRAALMGQGELVAMLLDHGAHPDCRTRFATPDYARATALHWCAWAGHADVAAVLLDRGAQIDLRDYAGSTPLHYACIQGQPSTASLLVQRGADHGATDEQGRTPLMLAILGDGPNDVALMLIDRGADVNATNAKTPARFNALHACVDAGPHRLPVARRLLDAGADPTMKDPESMLTPRQVAQMFVRLGHAEYQTYVDLL